jgi:hypothetical protein
MDDQKPHVQTQYQELDKTRLGYCLSGLETVHSDLSGTASATELHLCAVPCQHPRLLPRIRRTGHDYQRIFIRNPYSTRKTSPDTQAGTIQCLRTRVHETRSQKPAARKSDPKIHICLSRTIMLHIMPYPYPLH